MRLLSAVALQGTPWRHPWQTSVRWNGKKTRWEARIKAGMVNALPATVRLDKADWPSGFSPSPPLQPTSRSRCSPSFRSRASVLSEPMARP